MSNLYCNGRRMVPYEYMTFYDDLPEAQAEAEPLEELSKMVPEQDE